VRDTQLILELLHTQERRQNRLEEKLDAQATVITTMQLDVATVKAKLCRPKKPLLIRLGVLGTLLGAIFAGWSKAKC
jgi:hypothetical protein